MMDDRLNSDFTVRTLADPPDAYYYIVLIVTALRHM